MNIVIVGLGKVGQLLTQYLSDEGHNLVVIDHNDQKVENFVNQFDVLGICGNGANYHVLEEANVQDADIVIAVTSSDELNILSCLMAKQIGAKHLIARVRNPDYSAQKDVFINQLGFAMIINPELEAAKDIRRTLMFSSAIRIDTFAKGKAEMIELRITEKNRLCHTSLNELNQLTRAHILIAAMRRQEEVIIPNGEDVFEVNDHIHVIGTHQDLIRFCIDTGFTTKSLKHVMIIGGSKIAYYLAQQLSTFGIHTKIIEQNHQRCIELSQQLPEATIIEGDGSNEDLLIEEELPHHDALVCLTGLDEENIVLGLVAKQIGVQKAIAKVNHRSLGNSIIDQLGIDSIVDPKKIIASHIITYVRIKSNNGRTSSLKTLYKVINEKVEAVEFEIHARTPHLNESLSVMPIRRNLLIGGIIRHGKLIIPRGNDTFKAGDRVIVVANQVPLKDISDLFEEDRHE